jgi:hypothetical protein
LRLPHGATARVRPYKSQNVFLKNYSRVTREHSVIQHVILNEATFSEESLWSVY